MKKVEIGEGNKKVVKGNKLADTNKITLKGSGDMTFMDISLCLCTFMQGLNIHLSVGKEAGARAGIMAVSLHGKAIGLYDMEWDEDINPEDGGLEISAEVTGANELSESYGK